MAALNLAGKTSGYIKLKSPDVALNATVELPNKDGILATLDDVGSGGGGGASSLDGLEDVTVLSPSDGQILVYNVGKRVWENTDQAFDEVTLSSLNIPNHNTMIVNEAGDVSANSFAGDGSQLTNLPEQTTGAKAWVNFNGTGTVAIRTSNNVSSITDNGTGEYTMNFTTALTDDNCCALVSGGTNSLTKQVVSTSATSCRIRYFNGSINPVDESHCFTSIFR